MSSAMGHGLGHGWQVLFWEHGCGHENVLVLLGRGNAGWEKKRKSERKKSLREWTIYLVFPSSHPIYYRPPIRTYEQVLLLSTHRR